jgi:hypothetical protein
LPVVLFVSQCSVTVTITWNEYTKRKGLVWFTVLKVKGYWLWACEIACPGRVHEAEQNPSPHGGEANRERD